MNERTPAARMGREEPRPPMRTTRFGIRTMMVGVAYLALSLALVQASPLMGFLAMGVSIPSFGLTVYAVSKKAARGEWVSTPLFVVYSIYHFLFVYLIAVLWSAALLAWVL